jgi:hypothetical protein
LRTRSTDISFANQMIVNSHGKFTSIYRAPTQIHKSCRKYSFSWYKPKYLGGTSRSPLDYRNRPPIAPKFPIHKEFCFENGSKRIITDNYAWMQHGSKQLEEYIDQENNYSQIMMRHTKELQMKLYKVGDRHSFSLLNSFKGNANKNLWGWAKCARANRWLFLLYQDESKW